MPKITTDIRQGDGGKPLAQTTTPPSEPQDFAPNSGYQRQQLTVREATEYLTRNKTTPVIVQPKELFAPHMSNYYNIYTSSTYRFAQNNPDLLLTSKGYRILDEMLTMSACRGPFNLKRYLVLANPGRVVPFISDTSDPNYEKALELSNFCTYALDNIVDVGDVQQSFRTVLWDLLRAAWDGFHVTDIIYRQIGSGPYEGKIGYAYFASKPVQEMGFDLDADTLSVRNLMPYTLQTSYEPPKPVESSILYTYNPQHGLPYGVGDGRASYKHYFILNHLLEFWSIAMERWGSPIMVLQFPAGDAASMEAAQATSDSIRSGSAPVLPDNVSYEVVKIDSGAVEGFKRAADWHVEQIALNILGSTLTTGEGERSGSMALGKVHQNSQESAVNSPRADLEEVVRLQLFRRLIRYNYGGEFEWLAPYYKLTPPRSLNGQDALGLAQALNLLVGMGNTLPTSKIIRETLDLPPIDPDEEDELIRKSDLEEKLNTLRSAPTPDDEEPGSQSLSGRQRADGKRGQAATGKRKVGKAPQEYDGT
jgi:hypothetical protein